MQSRSIVSVVACVSILALAAPVGAFHGQTCSATGATPMSNTLGVRTFSGILGVNAVHKYSTTLGSGEWYATLTSVGDADLVVCRPGALLNQHACTSGNVMPVPDSCLLGIPGNPGSGTPIVGPGTFVFYVIYCSGTVCGYPANVPLVPYVGTVV